MGDLKVRNKGRAIALLNQRSPQNQRNYPPPYLTPNPCAERLNSVTFRLKSQVCV